MNIRHWLPLVLLLTACAAPRTKAPATAAREAAPPSSPDEARRELDRLAADIQRHRAALGLPTSAAPAGGSTAAELDGRAETAAAPPPAEPAASPAPMADEGASDSEQVLETRPGSTGGARRPRCSSPCKLSQAICRAAARICDLADYLGDPGAAARCSRARADCDEARKKSGWCPAGCR